MSTTVQVRNRIGAEAEVGRKVLEALLDRNLQEEYPADPMVSGTTTYSGKNFGVTFLGVGEVQIALGLQESSGEWKGGISAEIFPRQGLRQGLYLGILATSGDEILVTMEDTKVDL